MELFIPIIILILYLSVVALAILFVIWLGQSLLFEAPFVPLPWSVVEKVVALANLSGTDKFYDLGSGDGRVVRAMARRHQSSTCIGVEKAFFPNLLAWLHHLVAGTSNVEYQRADFRQVPLQSAKVIFLYLWPTIMLELKDKLKAEVPVGAQIITCRFALADFKLQSQHTVSANGQTYQLYVYSSDL